ncbi:LANO_0F16886g1_1 [Lachancea nothofagi CBS 11611]|uniref:LANO_0F16886g1_1 n=1 Tax=Lachancea nothofagi CBS 11611 TaxID=1266666 RepID=A0A1G4KD14_9SACH|nr:LANO_0F16886g1_1 [Lachancea nothofagi CBS 11611]
MPEYTKDAGGHVPVSILAKSDGSTREITSYKGSHGNSENDDGNSPSYRPMDEVTYVNPHKLKIVTSARNKDTRGPHAYNLDSIDGDETSGPPTGSSFSGLKSPTSALGTAVSFTMSNITDKISHRGSISARPSSVALTTQSSNNNVASAKSAEERQNSLTGDSFDGSATPSRQNSVHMPGEFIFMEPRVQYTPQSASPSGNSSSSRKQPHHINKALIDSQIGPQLPFTEFFQKQDDKKIHILIGATGSVATIKVPVIIDKLYKTYGPDKVSIQLVVTKPAQHFLRGLKISTDVKIWRDEDEWCGFKRMGDPVLHTELRRWADICLIAPLSANTLAKLAYGICDNLLTSLLRSWTPSTPVLVAPAMNTFMYTHPVTKKHLNMLQEESPYITILKPVEKVLICGDIGMGGMRDWHDIVDILTRKLSEIRGGIGADAADDDDDDDEEEEGDTNLPDETDSDDSGIEDEDDGEDDNEKDEASQSVHNYQLGTQFTSDNYQEDLRSGF